MDQLFEQRRKWFEGYIQRIENGVSKPPQSNTRYACPCCGYPTLFERGGYEICELCNWEDDGQDDPHENEIWGGPNGSYSLASARLNFQRYYIMYDPHEVTTRIRGNMNSAIEDQAKRTIAGAFDVMIGETDQSVIDSLWQRIFDAEKILNNEKLRRVREYEAQAKNHGTSSAAG